MNFWMETFRWLSGHLLWIAPFALIFLFARCVYDRIAQIYTVKWFRPLKCAWRESCDWDDIEKIIKDDPLDQFKGIRWPSPRIFISDLAICILAAAFLSGVSFLLWSLSLAYESGALPSTGNLEVFTKEAGIPAAMLALAGTLYTAAMQLRAKVRSENRQAWINDVRTTLAEVMNHIPHQQPALGHMGLASDANRARLRLELLLNPSEKDHRTLGVLLRKAYNLREIDIDEKVFRKLPMININPWADNEKRLPELITWIIRLSNAMLKREWELIKYGK